MHNLDPLHSEVEPEQVGDVEAFTENALSSLAGDEWLREALNAVPEELMLRAIMTKLRRRVVDEQKPRLVTELKAMRKVIIDELIATRDSIVSHIDAIIDQYEDITE